MTKSYKSFAVSEFIKVKWDIAVHVAKEEARVLSKIKLLRSKTSAG